MNSSGECVQETRQALAVVDALNPLALAFFKYPEPLADLVNEHLAMEQ